MKKIKIIILILFISNTLLAQDFWEEITLPDTFNVSSIAFTTGTTFLGTGRDGHSSATYRSFDNCETWSYSYEIGGYSMYVTDNQTVFIGAMSVYRSIDNGDEWETVFSTFDNVLSFIEIDHSGLLAGSWGSAYKSNDYGDTWNTVLTFDQTKVIFDLAKTSNGYLYAAATNFLENDDGVYRSTDNGDTWEFTAISNDMGFTSLGVNSKDEIFAGSHGGGIYKSTDYGENWELILEGGGWMDIAIDKNDVIYAGWNELSAVGGIIVSYDNGKNWETLNNGLDRCAVEKLEISPDNYLYCVAEHRLFRSKNKIVTSNEKIQSMKCNFSIYPNPADDFINIILPYNKYNNTKIKIFDIYGKLIDIIAVHNKKNFQYQTNNLNNGIYLFQIQNPKHTKAKKVIIKH